MEVRGRNFASRPVQQKRVIREVGTHVAPLLAMVQAGCTDVRRSSQTMHQAYALYGSMPISCRAGLVYCMDYIVSNMDWLREQLKPLEEGGQRAPRLARSCSTSVDFWPPPPARRLSSFA